MASVFLSQSNAKAKFLGICRRALELNQKIYVKDKSGKCFLTLDPINSAKRLPAVEVSAQRFKDEFSQFSSLVKFGYRFRLTLQNETRVLIVRRHTSYSGALDDVVKDWHSAITGKALSQERCKIGRRSATEHERIVESLEKLALGIARLGIGHLPFEEGGAKKFERDATPNDR